MDVLDKIKQPIEENLEFFAQEFDKTLENPNSYLSQIFSSVKKKGKLMRPILLLLVAKEYGEVNNSSYLSAVTLEMLHTASLIHDDVVDESNERRGNPSVNAVYGNKVAVLSGDYLLSTSLIKICETKRIELITRISKLGKQLSQGEILQLKNSSSKTFSEESYLDAINLKTATLFSTCAELGAVSVNASAEDVEKMRLLGDYIGMCFQIRDDIFDYYNDNIGKPTGNDLAEGKITLPLIYALTKGRDAQMLQLAQKVKALTVTKDEIAQLVLYAKEQGGIEYAHQKMQEYAQKAQNLIVDFKHNDIKEALSSYIQYVTDRTI